jgi:glycosyltransferase involved in cell wall biosynthesis
MKKVAFIINVDWYFLLHWLDRVQAIRDSGYQVVIITRFSNPENFQRVKDAGFTCYEFKLTRKSVNPLLEARNIFRIYMLIKELSPEIVHAVTIKPVIYAGLVCRYLRIPFMGNITGLGSVFSSRSVFARLLKILVKRFYRLVFSNSNSLALFENGDDQNMFLQNRIITMESSVVISGAGIDLKKFSYDENHPHGTPVVLFASRMIVDKGIYDFIEAIEYLKAQRIPVKAQVAGILDEDALNCVHESQLNQWHDQGIVEWLGQCEDMPKLFRSSNVVVLPTKYGEGIPRVLIEAAAVGRPIVATDVTGCREIVKNEYNGLLVPAGDVKKLSCAIKKVISNTRKQREYGRNGRELVLKKFTKEKIIDQTIRAYTLIERKSRMPHIQDVMAEDHRSVSC